MAIVATLKENEKLISISESWNKQGELSENGQEDDKVYSNGLVEDKHWQHLQNKLSSWEDTQLVWSVTDKVNLKMNTESDTIYNVSFHPFWNNFC